MHDLAAFIAQHQASILALGIGFYCLFKFAHNLRLANMVLNTPTSKVRSAAQGFVELEGISRRLDHPTASPLTQTACLWYRYRVEKRSGGKNKGWREVSAGESGRAFLLEDSTGCCVIDPHGADMVINDKQVWYGHTPFPTTVSSSNFLLALESEHNYRYTEEIIFEGNTLYALGAFKTRRAIDDYDQSSAVAEILRDWKQRPEVLLKIFDNNNDGRIDQHEWEKVRNAAHLHSEQEYKDLLTKADIHTLEKAPKRPFIIATKDQTHLASGYKWRTLGYTAGLLLALSFLAYRHG